jgi:hypothetical protein
MTRRTGLSAGLSVALAVLGPTTVAGSELRELRAAGEAPAILLHMPRDGGVYASPLGIDIDFEPAGDAEIDLSTLKVTVVTHTMLGDLSFDITEDVSRYVWPGGIRADQARIPAGEHTVTISVADTLQRRAERQLTIVVRDERARAD